MAEFKLVGYIDALEDPGGRPGHSRGVGPVKGTETIYRIRGDQRFEAQVELTTKTAVSERPVGKRVRFPGGNR